MKINKRKRFYQKDLALYKSIFSFFIFAGLGISLITVFYTSFALNIISLVLGSESLQNPTGPMLLVGKILGSYWFYIILGSAFLVCLANFFTHRFAGPLIRYEMSLDKMINNDVSFKINLRKDDETKQLAEKINQFNARLSSTFKSLAFLSGEVEKNHLMLQKTLKEDKHVLEQATALNRKLKKIVAAFKYE